MMQSKTRALVCFLVMLLALFAHPVFAQHSVTLSWTQPVQIAPEVLASTNIYRNSTRLISGIQPGTTQYIDSLVNAGSTYTYSATNVDTLGVEGSPSTSVVVTIPVVTVVALSPISASIPVSSTKQFTATVSGSTNIAVTWTATCGTISSSGLYTAPSIAATCSVKATSQADTTAFAVASVSVTASVLTPYVIRPLVPLVFLAVAGVNPSKQTFVADDSSPIAANLTLATDRSWLSAVSSTNSTAKGNIVTVTVTSAALVAGTYTGHVIITVPNQSGDTWTNSPYSLSVTLTVTGTLPVQSMLTSCAWLADGVTWQCNSVTKNVTRGQAIRSVITTGTLSNTVNGTKP